MNIPSVGSTTLDAQASSRARDDKPAVASSPAAGAPRVTSIQDPTSANAKHEASREPSNEQVRDAVKEMNRAMQQSNRALEFSVDEASDRLVVKLKDGETGEVIRQFPSDETLAISRYIADVQQGLLLSQKA